MDSIALLLSATLLGGMVFFSFGFAPVLFKQLPMEQVRPLLRGTFPYYYLVVIALSAVTSVAVLPQSTLAAALLGVTCLSTVYARQMLMGQINAATDRGDGKAFHRLHMASVVIQVVQIGLCGWAVVLVG